MVLAVCQCVRECAMSEREGVKCVHACVLCCCCCLVCFFFVHDRERVRELHVLHRRREKQREREVVLLLMCVRTQHEDGERRDI